MRHVLRLDGHELAWAADGTLGLALVTEFRPELIICDVLMPHLGGYAVLETVRANPQSSHVPVLLFSAFMNEEARAIALAPRRDRGAGQTFHTWSSCAARSGVVWGRSGHEEDPGGRRRSVDPPEPDADAEGGRLRGGRAEDGRAGIEHAKRFAPDLIVSDVMMPELDGFSMLEALRADPRFADTPFIFLTALNDRTSMRRGMNLGADDFLNKPFTRDELIEAVNSRLKKYENAARSLAERLVAGNDELRRWYRQSLTGDEAERPLAFAETAGMTGKMTVATVLFADIRNFTTYSERLTAGQIAELLNAYFEAVCQPIVRNGGRIAKLIGDGIMVVFEAREKDGEDNHACRAIRAGLGIVLAANKFGEWFKRHFDLGGVARIRDRRGHPYRRPDGGAHRAARSRGLDRRRRQRQRGFAPGRADQGTGLAVGGERRHRQHGREHGDHGRVAAAGVARAQCADRGGGSHRHRRRCRRRRRDRSRCRPLYARRLPKMRK